MSAPASDGWPVSLKQLWKDLVPIGGEAETLQGELVRCIHNLDDEAERNGWINFDAGDLEMLDVLRRYLPGTMAFSDAIRQQIHDALDAIRYAGERGADSGFFASDELIFLAQRVADFCRHHDELIYKRPEATWLDDDPIG